MLSLFLLLICLLAVPSANAGSSDRASSLPSSKGVVQSKPRIPASVDSGPAARAGVSSPADQRVPGVLVGLLVTALLVALAVGLSVARRFRASGDRAVPSGWAREAAPPLRVELTPGEPAVGRRISEQGSALRTGGIVVTAGAFTFIAVVASLQIERLIWRPVEVLRMLDAATSIAVDFPLRFAVLMLMSVALMMAAEYRPRALLDGSVALWLGLGGIGTGAYLLSLLDLGPRWALGILLGAGTAVTAAALTRTVRRTTLEERPEAAQDPGHTRTLFPLVIGLIGGMLAVRASIEPVTQSDAIVSHVSFARDWMHTLPGLPHAAGPSAGAEVSYNYPALFSSISVAIAAPLHVSVVGVARLISPLAAVTILAALRLIGTRSGFVGWAPSMFLLGSTLFVAYAEWPTAYMLMLLLLVLAAGRLFVDRRLQAPTAALIGLIAGTVLIGLLFAAIVLGTYWGFQAGRRERRLPSAAARWVLLRFRKGAVVFALLGGPIAVVALASLHHTRGLLFPWLAWPGGGHLLPEPEWSSTQHVLLANPYGHPNVSINDLARAARAIVTSNLLVSGGLVLSGLIVAASTVATAFRRRALLSGTAVVLAVSLLLLSLELLRFGYFLPVSIAAALGVGTVVGALTPSDRPAGHWFRIGSFAHVAAAAAAAVSLATGAIYALAGPNDREYTATTNYARDRASAFENARDAADARRKAEVVFGDDARAWRDIERLDARGAAVGTFDDRNYRSRYRAGLQLDGFAGASITASTAPGVARQLKAHGIAAVFVPSKFWEPGVARSPLVDLSPVALWVGSPSLRAMRVYLPNEDVTYPSVLYGVGSSGGRRVESVLNSPAFSIAGPLSSRQRIRNDGFAFEGALGGGLHWRVAAPVTEAGGPDLRFTTRDLRAAPDVTVYEPRTPTLFKQATFVDCSHAPGWAHVSTLDVLVPGSPLGFAVLDVAGRPEKKESFRSELTRRVGGVLVRACGDPTSPRGGVFPAGSTSDSIIVDRRLAGRSALSFDYLDVGRHPVSFSLYDELRDRLIDVTTVVRCGTRRWLHAFLPLPPVAGTSVELRPVVAGSDFTIRDLHLVEAPVRRISRC